METQNKLKIHHVAKRLPYGLKFYDSNLEEISTLFSIDTEENIFETINEESFDIYDSYGYNMKQILFPLSSLTETITIKGESFIPIDEIEDGLDIPEGASCLLKDVISSFSDFFFTKDLTDILRYSDIININELLLKWHIDLPHENLIEKVLAISVFDLTENPYA